MRALDFAVRQGKVRFVGACNFPAWLFAHCNAIAGRNGWAGRRCMGFLDRAAAQGPHGLSGRARRRAAWPLQAISSTSFKMM